MKVKVNIGTSVKNIVGVWFDKPFKDITYRDIMDVATKNIPDVPFRLHGWCDVTDTPDLLKTE